MSHQSAGGARGWVTWLLAVAFVIFLFSFQTGYSIVNSNVQKDVGLTVAQVGLVAATYTWSFALFQLFGGSLLDRLGARRVIAPAIAIFTLGIFLFSQATSVQAIAAAQLVLALGACVGFVGAGYVGGKWFGMAKFSLMFGLVQCLASLFSAFGQNFFDAALRHLHWRELFVFIALGGGVLCVLAVLGIRDPVPAAGLGRGVSRFVRDVVSDIAEVARVGRVWLAAAFGALVFGVLLANGVVWAPKLMQARGMGSDTANLAASVLWLGLSLGCFVIPWWSDASQQRKLPALTGIVLQLAAIAALVYVPMLGTASSIVLWFIFGFGAASHMLAFSMAGDIVPPQQIGTSAAIVNGTMFLLSGILIARPGVIASREVATRTPVSMDLAEMAARPFMVGLVAALVLCLVIRESYPNR